MAEKKEVIITPKEEFAYGHIIEALAGGLYPNKFHVIREYIQNAFDAVVNFKKTRRSKKKLSISISIQKPSIFIFDNGTGMNQRTINEYRKIGFSKKMMGEFAGFRGIGKLAGISVAKKLIIKTSPYGEKKRYILSFNADGMLHEIGELKKQRENIPLNNLIAKYTALKTESEKKTEHFTMVELQEIRQDSTILFNDTKIIDYLSRNVPVPFNPEFDYAEDIEDDIKKFVNDYDCVPISMNGHDVFKPFTKNLKPPKHIIIWDNRQTDTIRGFCWYCENKAKGQIKPTDISGLVYRYKNFAVGDNYLTRKAIWNTSEHLAFYFMGEIHVTDPNIVPTSQRDDFEQSIARDSFYKEGTKKIVPELNRIAYTSSGIRRATEFINKGSDTVSQIEGEFKKGELHLRELSVEKITQLSNVITDIQKREKNIPLNDKKTKRKAARVVNKAKKLLEEFEEDKETIESKFNITKKLKLNKQGADVYAIAIKVLKDVFVGKPDELEKIIKIFQQKLIKHFLNQRK